MTRVVVAPDKFKGTYSAVEVASAIAQGLRVGGCEVQEVPVADGGDDTARVLLAALGGRWVAATATDALGRPISAGFALLEGGRVAVVDAAEASGLWRLADAERDPLVASTAGTGELVLDAVAVGVEEVVIAAGGSATVDGGEGAVAVLRRARRLPRLTVACDVTTSWEDAARVFGPQKGANGTAVRRLEERLTRLAQAAPRDPRGVPGTGAAGGLSGALWAHFGAVLRPGAAYVLDALGFDAAIAGSALVVTGEGRMDRQTLAGKAAGEVARRAQARKIPCDAVVGSAALEREDQARLGVRHILEASDLAAMVAAGECLARTLVASP